MEQELLILQDASEAAYQQARGELRRLQRQSSRSDFEAGVLDDGLWAYDLEFTIRGYMDRMSKGQHPAPDWLEDIRSAWKFYNSDVYRSSHEIVAKSWPAIFSYQKSVIKFERAVISYLSRALAD